MLPSTAKIDKLTQEQEQQLISYRDHWLALGRNTEPADRPRAEAAIKKVYAWIGEQEPYFRWCDGPFVGSMERTWLTTKRDNLRAKLVNNVRAKLISEARDKISANLAGNFREDVRANLELYLEVYLRESLSENVGTDRLVDLNNDPWRNFRDTFWRKLWDTVEENVAVNLKYILWDSIRDNLYDNLWRNLWGNLQGNLWQNHWENLNTNLEANLWENLEDTLGDYLRENLRRNVTRNLADNFGINLGWCFGGPHEGHWQALAEFPDKYLRPMHSEEEREKLQVWLDISASCGWWQPYRGVVFVCERPSICSVDDRGRLHSDAGPAYLCRDSFAVYAWHGVRVPSRVIEHPEDVTVAEILKERNAEARRIMVERYGTSRYLLDAGAKQIHAFNA